MEQWREEHTVKVNATTIYKYEQGYLEIKEIYTGKDLEKKFGVDNLTRVLKISVDAEAIGMKEGEEKVFVSEKTVVVTIAGDPYHWWENYEYPQWTYSLIVHINPPMIFYFEEDPINLAWENSDKDTVKSVILEQGWVDNPAQYNHYVYDPEYGWILNDGVADDVWRPNGGYHARLWQMSDGNVVSNAHHDSNPPHHADEYEPAEELVAGFYDLPVWAVSDDSYNHENEYTNEYGAYNNGWTTQITHI